MDAETEKIVSGFVSEFRKDNPQVPEKVVIAAVSVNVRRNQDYELVAFRRVRGTGIEIIYRKPDGNLVGCAIFNHISYFLHYNNNDTEWAKEEGIYADNSMRVTPQIVKKLVNDINNR